LGEYTPVPAYASAGYGQQPMLGEQEILKRLKRLMQAMTSAAR
jgi:hypothetical protein